MDAAVAVVAEVVSVGIAVKNRDPCIFAGNGIVCVARIVVVVVSVCP